ncbi:MAG: Na+/H+ antiporter NhaA [Bacteroidia bacterium]|nr:Na+/H+ antiporter NhaA [Bacteroidia bacterium]
MSKNTAPLFYRISSGFRLFVRSQQFSGFLLIGCTLLSVLLANSEVGEAYLHLFHAELPLSIPGIHHTVSVEWLINDGLMAVFFLLVGLEIKRELLVGELSSFQKASLPVMAAIGGMIAPALFYSAFNAGTPSVSGWGIPMATDIAFALGVLSLLGNRVPLSLKVFLTALAVVDDLGAVGVIAVFYTHDLSTTYLSYAAAVLLLLMIMNRSGINSLWKYLIPGLVLWYCVLQSGVHATVAGVLLALCIPHKTRKGPPLLSRLEERLHTPVNYFIMPLFALANTALPIKSEMVTHLSDPIALGVIFGLVVGKPVGIFLFSWLSVTTGLSQLPAGTRFRELAGLGMLGGIGFTMAIFIALLAFRDPGQIVEAKIAILVASLLSGIFGYLFLSKSLHERAGS